MLQKNSAALVSTAMAMRGRSAGMARPFNLTAPRTTQSAQSYHWPDGQTLRRSFTKPDIHPSRSIFEG